MSTVQAMTQRMFYYGQQVLSEQHIDQFYNDTIHTEESSIQAEQDETPLC